MSEYSEKKKRVSVAVPETQSTLAQLYKRQTDAYYSLPRQHWPKREIRFSPSSAGECSRKLFYELTNAELDVPKPQIPFQARVPRVGDGLHHANQEDAKKMDVALSDAGIKPSWRVKRVDGRPAIEIDYDKTFTVDDVDVRIKGRLDAVIEFINEQGEVTDEAVLDWKIKMQMSKLAPSNIVRETEHYRPQMVAYTLLTGIPNVIIEYESAQKPKWGDAEDAKDDEVYVHIVPTDEERQALLDKFSAILRHIRDKTMPDAEEGYHCNFCPFTKTCSNVK